MKNVKPTVACRESGAGERLLENLKRGSVPSVEKVQLLAQYLGVTTSELLGETPGVPKSGTGPPEILTLHDSAVRLTVSEVELALAYRRADDRTKTMVQLALEPFEKERTTSSAG